MRTRQFLAFMACLCFALGALGQADQKAKSSRLRISSGVAEGLKIHDEQPVYPVEARRKGITGDVLLGATIDTKGKIASLIAIQGDPILVEAAMDAVKKWRYRPYVLNGDPVEVETTIKIQFRM
jgi:protein TonB